MLKTIDVTDLYPKWLAAKDTKELCTIVDVRELQEYVQGHVPGATLIALNSVPERVDEFPKDRDVYVICRSGMRSAQAIKFLAQQHGYQNLINVSGGTMAWIEKNYAVEQGE
ncbi:MAG: rhodanese-like domain-containing protein [Mariprofundaceae bacterium]